MNGYFQGEDGQWHRVGAARQDALCQRLGARAMHRRLPDGVPLCAECFPPSIVGANQIKNPPVLSESVALVIPT